MPLKKKLNVLVRGHRWHQFRCLSEMGQAKCLKHETTIHFRKQNQSKEETFLWTWDGEKKTLKSYSVNCPSKLYIHQGIFLTLQAKKINQIQKKEKRKN